MPRFRDFLSPLSLELWWVVVVLLVWHVRFFWSTITKKNPPLVRRVRFSWTKMTPKNPHRNSNNGGFSLELWWCVVVLLVSEVGAQAVGNRVENTKHPRCNSGVTDVTADLVAGGAPPEPGEDDDPGEEVEECPDEADDEGGDDDEEEEVVVPEPKEVSTSVDCLSWGSARHTDDPKNQLNYLDDALERLEVADIQSNLHWL